MGGRRKSFWPAIRAPVGGSVRQAIVTARDVSLPGKMAWLSRL
jgi:hypothetical protein